jgi:hypothetical protein
MAVTPDPVGAYNQSFQTADTSRRDYERLEMQRQQQAEAAIQRAREQKANDFKMMMEALGRQDTLKQQVIDNQFKKEQLANQTMTAQADAYRARNPLSRSGQGMLNISPPGSEQTPSATPGDGTTSSAVPPIENVSASGAEGELPTGTSGEANEPNILLGENPPTMLGAPTDPIPVLKPGDRLPLPQTQTPAVPPATPNATPTTPLGSPGLLPVSTPAFTPTPSVLNAGLMPRTVALTPAAVPAMDAPIAAQTQPIPQTPAASTTAPAVSVPRRSDLMGYMLNRTDPYTDKIGIPRVAQMPEVPVFGQADIATGGRDQLKQLASVIETAQMARAQAPRNIDDARSLINSGKLVPARVAEWTNYIKQQDRVAAASASIEGEAAQQLLEAKENIKGIESRQGALNRLGNLNGVLPIGDRRQIYQEASDPGMAQLAEQKIAVLTEYDAFRQLNGITNASRGYRTAEQVVRAKRELDSKEAEADRKLAENSQAYQAAIKARPDMDEKAKAELELEIGKANPAQIRQNERVTRLNDALKADRLPPRPPATAEAVKPEDIKVNPATGTAAAAPGIDRSRGRDMMSNQQKVDQANQAAGNEYWGANTRDVAQQVFMDGGRDENGNIIPPFSIALLKKIAEGQAPVEGTSSAIEGPSVGAPIYGEKYVDTIAKENLSNWTPTQGDPIKWGRQTQPTAQDFLKIAAKQRLDKINAGAANAPVATKVSEQEQKLANKIQGGMDVK